MLAVCRTVKGNKGNKRALLRVIFCGKRKIIVLLVIFIATAINNHEYQGERRHDNTSVLIHETGSDPISNIPVTDPLTKANPATVTDNEKVEVFKASVSSQVSNDNVLKVSNTDATTTATRDSDDNNKEAAISKAINIPLDISTTVNTTSRVFDKDACLAAIKNATSPLLLKNAVPTMLSRKRMMNIVDLMSDAALRPGLNGDWVETGTWKGGGSLIAASVQRAAIQEPACGNVRRRSIWLADSFEGLPPNADNEKKEDGYMKNMDPPGSYAFEGGLETVKNLFKEHGFAVDGTGEVPIQFLKGWFADTLPNSLIADIAILRLDGDMYSSTLQALFSLYRRVHIDGYVIIDDYGHWPQCAKAIDEFFNESSIDLKLVDYTGRYFQKSNTNIKIPPQIEDYIKPDLDERVEESWILLKEWILKTQTARGFVGNIWDNRYQTLRYTEVMNHTIEKKKRENSSGDVRLNVCETGFNGGHSAMLFMAFMESNVNIHYYGWDLGVMKSSHPIADKMSEKFGENFHIVWGDSKETLQNVSETMQGQLCHIIVIDGEHSKDGVTSDINNFLKVAEKGATLFGDDCAPARSNYVRKSPQMLSAWNEFIANKQIISVASYINTDLKSPGFTEGFVPEENDGSKLSYI